MRLLWLLPVLAHAAVAAEPKPTAWLTETVIVGDYDLKLVEGGRNTYDVLIDLLNMAEHTADVTAMYWDLIPESEGFTSAELQAMGAARGPALYAAFHAAARRGVKIRFVLDSSVEDDGDEGEYQQLKAAYPDQIEGRFWNADAWYSGGIAHQKLWIVDGRHAYVGSANMDWKSLAQVKEMGVTVMNAPQEAQEVVSLFELWWAWADPSATPATSWYPDPHYGVAIDVPCFSELARERDRCISPMAEVRRRQDAPASLVSPAKAWLNGTLGSFFISATPRDVLPTGGSSRTWGQDAMVAAIRGADKFVYLSVMDFVPSTLYSGGYGDEPLWWHQLLDALLVAAITHGVEVRVLVSKWAHTDNTQLPYMRALQQNGKVCHLSDWVPCTGRLTVRVFEVPGWNETVADGVDNPAWPSYSRVNHAKYVVTDKTAHVSTNNFVWSYMYSTAGAAFDTDHEPLRSAVQTAFERDWGSAYALPLDDAGA